MKSYLRFLSRNKLYTAIEVVGLSIAIAFVIPLIGYYTTIDQVSKGHDNYENIYSLCYAHLQASSPKIGSILKEQIPEIERITSPITGTTETLDEVARRIDRIDKDFFYFFPCKFIEGDIGFLDTDGGIAVSTEYAEELAKDGPVLGRIIKGQRRDYTVEAVFDDYGKGIFKKCDVLADNDEYVTGPDMEYPLGVYGSMTVMSIRKDAQIENITQKIRKVSAQYWGGIDKKYRDKKKYRLIRYDNMTTDSAYFIKRNEEDGKLTLSVICILLYVISLINYINLNLALASKRASEMATRKLCGADNISIIIKYCTESLIFTSACFAFGLVLTRLTVPALDYTLQATGLGEAGIQLSWDFRTILLLTCTVFITALICGLTPAILVSRFTALDVTKGDYRFHSKKILSKVFICFEILLTVVFTAVTLNIESEYRKKLDCNFNCNIKDVYVFKPADIFDKSIDKLRQVLEQRQEVLKVGTINSGYPGFLPLELYHLPGDDHNVSFMYTLMYCDESAFDLFEFKKLEDYGRTDKTGIWITPDAEDFFAEYPGSFEHIIEERGLTQYDIVGKVDDYPSVSVNTKDYITANMISVRPNMNHVGRSLVIKTISDHKKARKVIAQAYEEVYGEKVTDLMKFGRRSEYIEDRHKETLNPLYIFVKLFRCVMLIAIFITMIGLFAISQYFIMERKQETAVRKVFGGTIHSETVRNTATYMKLAIISCIIAIPIIHTIFRIMKRSIISDVESTLWIYIVCILLSLIISIISVLWQTLRAARTNPAEALKKE